MAVEKFVNAGIFFDGRNYTGQINTVALQRKVVMLDASVFGFDTKINAPGQDEVTVSASGFWNVSQAVGSQAIDPNLYNAQGGVGNTGLGDPILVYPKNVSLDPAYFHPAVLNSFNFFGEFGELTPFSGEWIFSSHQGDRVQQCRGVLGLPFGAYTNATENGAGFQFTSVFGAGDFLVMTVHLVSTDATSVTFRVESDDTGGFGTPTTRITSPAMVAGDAFLDDLAGPIATDTFFRIVATRTGGTTFSAVAAFGKTTPQ